MSEAPARLALQDLDEDDPYAEWAMEHGGGEGG